VPNTQCSLMQYLGIFGVLEGISPTVRTTVSRPRARRPYRTAATVFRPWFPPSCRQRPLPQASIKVRRGEGDAHFASSTPRHHRLCSTLATVLLHTSPAVPRPPRSHPEHHATNELLSDHSNYAGDLQSGLSSFFFRRRSTPPWRNHIGEPLSFPLPKLGPPLLECDRTPSEMRGPSYRIRIG
jgi:hypothetical protein